MSTINDENTRAVARHAHDRVASFLNYFHDDPNASFENFKPDNIQYLEELKMDLVALASAIETRLIEAYGQPMEDRA